MTQVSEEYLMGIRDGRDYLDRHGPDISEMREMLENILSTMKTFSAGPVKDTLKGERDFWRNQIRKVAP